ncbi:midasin [Nematocida minor]|uniref:midasin n=1 Tax=Nematocida minor TaxID=1912983 RepID=UPI002220A43D|nr:midasin [Nematocida minor]KAI5189619.1 midasin [Nematocida minor]
MNSFTTDTHKKEGGRPSIFQLSTAREIENFLQEYAIVKKLSVPAEIPSTIKAKEILYAAASMNGTPIVEIDAEDIQDTSLLVEQVHIEEKSIVRREGALVRAMKNGYWLIVNSKEKENPVTNYIVSEYEKIPGTETRPHEGFQMFIFSKDYSADASRGIAYTMQMHKKEEAGSSGRGGRRLPSGKGDVSTEKEANALLLARLARALAEESTASSNGTDEAVESIVSVVLLAIKKYGEQHEIENIAQEVERNTRIYYLLQIIMERIKISKLASPGAVPSQARARLYLILSDVLLGGLRTEERETKENSLREMMCVRCEETEHIVNRAVHETTACLRNEVEYVLTKPAVRLILSVVEGLAVVSSFLLIGETGTGKTTAVQKIFEKRKILLSTRYKDARKLLCVNLSKDTDISDLLGSYQFATSEQLALHINDIVQGYFELFFNEEKNDAFLKEIDRAAEERRIDVIIDTAEDLISKFVEKERKEPGEEKKRAIAKLSKALELLRRIEDGAQNVCVFVEGPLVRAALYGYWILLDESNLAPNSTLRYINTAVHRGQLSIIEDSGAVIPIDGRTIVFQCINPGDDHGKKNIEMDRTIYHWVDEIDRCPEDVLAVANGYGKSHTEQEVRAIVQFYTEIKQMAEKNGLRTGSNRQALFGIRNLIRTLKMRNIPVVEAVKVNFLTQLCIKHKALGKKLLKTIFTGEEAEAPKSLSSTSSYIITPQAQEYIREIESAISTHTAVLLEGTTSVGKTSLVKYIAQSRGKKVVRINNHEHTDITEYLGTFGVQYEEQNEAERTECAKPSESQALRMSEMENSTHETVDPKIKRQRTEIEERKKTDTDRTQSAESRDTNRGSSEFVYKEGALVQAVREGHWVLLDELNLAPTEVLESLNRLLDSNRELFIPATQKTVKAHPDFALFATQNPAESTDYRNRKHLSKAFRNRFIELYVEEKTREELEIVLHGMRTGKVYTRVLLDIYEALRILTCNRSHEYITLRELMKILTRFNHEEQAPFIDRNTKDEERLFYYTMLILTEKIRNQTEKEKIAKIVCTLFEKVFKAPFTVEKYTEAISVPMEEEEHAPLLTPGVTRTLRKIEAAWVAGENILLVGAPGIGKTYLSEYISKRMQTPSTVIGMHAGIELSDFIGGYKEVVGNRNSTEPESSNSPSRENSAEKKEAEKRKSQFVWKDGSLLEAMENGSALIIDEINLVPDSVLESLNELFDDRRMRVHETNRHISARDGFRIVGTMNPGDDYGKREVGKSISTRFTTIYVEALENNEEAVKYFLFYAEKYGLMETYDRTELYRAVHKALAKTRIQIESAREAEVLARYAGHHPSEEKQALDEVLQQGIGLIRQMPLPMIGPLEETSEIFGIHPFILQKREGSSHLPSYTFSPPSVKETLYRILQALFCRFNLLLEGPPGTGKTKIIEEVGRRLGKRVTRVNLSNETEMADLTGRNTPTDQGIVFIEGEFIRAITRGDWIIVDEINLATQSVLEGLNGCLDYRRRIYVPELGSVSLHPETVIFGTMNPKTSRTDGRKLLPKSFLSRFVRVHRGPFTEDDLRIILAQAPTPNKERAGALAEQLLQCRAKYQLNLRDCLRHMAIGSAHLVPHTHSPVELHQEGASDKACAKEGPMSSIVKAATLDEHPISNAHEFSTASLIPFYRGTSHGLFVGGSFLPCDLSKDPEYVITHGSVPALEALVHGINNAWPCIIKGAVGKGRAARFIARVTGRRICTVPCHKDMEPSDFLGRYTKGDDKSTSPFMWEDSSFIRAVEAGEIVLLKNINLVKNDVVDRLNSLFEIGGVLEIHEKGGSETRKVVTHPSTRFILTLAESAKDLSPALTNRSIQVHLAGSLSAIDMAKMLSMRSSRNEKSLTTAALHKVPSGLLNAHIKARKILDYDTVADASLRPLLADLSDLERESSVRNYVMEEEILLHLKALAKDPLEGEVMEILSSANPQQMESDINELVRRISLHAVDPEYRKVYTNSALHMHLKSKYETCSAFARKKAAGGQQENSRKTRTETSPSVEPEDALDRLIALRNKLESGESALRAYFEAMDLPFLPRKEVSLRMAKVKIMETVFSPESSFGMLKHLAVLQDIARVLDSLPCSIEQEIAALETEPPAYEALTELLEACLKYEIDPLIFPEIEKIEEHSRQLVENAIKKAKQNYYLYKYGVALVYKPAKPATDASVIRKKRKERNFKKFAYYLQGVVKDALTAEFPETLAFSLIRRDMTKYEDLWECFAYALLKSGIEKIAVKQQTVPVSKIGLEALRAYTGLCTPRESLSRICEILRRNEISFLSISPLHSQAVQALWRMLSNEEVSSRELSALVAALLTESRLSKYAPAEYAEESARYALDSTVDGLLSVSVGFEPKGLDLTAAEESRDLHRISLTARAVELIDQTHLEIKKAKNPVGKNQFDWGEEDGAKEYLLEKVAALKSLSLSTPAQKVAAELDALNSDAIHIHILSTPLNTARMVIYKEYAEISSYNPRKFSEIHAGWLLHLFSAIVSEETDSSHEKKDGRKDKIDSASCLYAIEEFLLQSTVGDMDKRVEIIRQMVENGGRYEIKNILVYFLPYLENIKKKKEKIGETVHESMKEIETALAIKMKTDGAIVPIREQSILIKANAIKENMENLLLPIVSVIKPQLFHRNVSLNCSCSEEECYVCMAKEVERQKRVLEKESMSVKLRTLYVLFEKLSVMMPAGTSRIGIVGAMEFYKHVYTGAEYEHVVLAKIVHIGTAVLKTDPAISFQIASRISDFTIKLLNYAMQASPAECRLIIVSLGLFFELMSFGFCGDEDEGMEGLIEELEDAGMRLGEGEKNISEKLKKEEEVGDDYKGEKDMQSEEIEEEDGVDCENAGEVQETAGAEDKPDIEVDNGSVSENEENFNQKNKEETGEQDEDAEGEAENEEAEKEEGSSEVTDGSENPEDLKEINVEEEKDEESDASLKVQDMDMCEEAGGEFDREDLEDVEDGCSLDEESLEGIELEEGEESDEEISIEKYESEEYNENIKQYDYAEIEVNPEQLIKEEDADSDAEKIGHEEGEGAEREVAVEKGDAMNEDAEDVEAEEVYTGEYKEAPDTEAPKRAPFERPSIKSLDPVSYYEEIKHITNPELTKQLSVVLEENEKSAYEGDYATGRRLNMKRIISYIASDGQKNRIWMRKTKNQGREYLIRIFVDNSGSIKNSSIVDALIKSLSSITNSLDLLGIPFELYTFSSTIHQHKDIRRLVEGLTFEANETRVAWVFEEEYRYGYNILISDGLFYDGALSQGMLSNTLLLIVGSGAMIKEMRTVKAVIGEVVIGKYLETLGIPYCIVDDDNLLEVVFCRELKNILQLAKKADS